MEIRLNRSQRQAFLKAKRLGSKRPARTNTTLNARLSDEQLERAAKQSKDSRRRNVDAFLRRGQPDPKPLDRWRELRKAKAATTKTEGAAVQDDGASSSAPVLSPPQTEASP